MNSALQGLGIPTLQEIGAALRSGRLQAPFSQSALQQYCRTNHAEAVAGEMQRLIEEGLRLEHLALMLNMIVVERLSCTSTCDGVGLVYTGPDFPGRASRDTGSVVRELFVSARNEVIVAGFAVHQGQEVFRILAERMENEPALRVQMFLDVSRPHTDTSADTEILARFAQRFRTSQWPGIRLPEVYYDPRALLPNGPQRASLHAKCIVIDQRVALVTSANFTQAAQARNIEVGMMIRSQSVAGSLADHFQGLAAVGLLVRLSGL